MFKPLDKIVKRIPFVPKSREIAYFKQEFERIDYERIYSDSIIRTSMDGIITISETGILETFNAGAQRIFGYTEAETIGKNIKMLMPEPYQSEHDSYLAHYVETGEKKVIGYEREAMGRRKDGSTFPIYLYVGEVYFKDKRIFTGIVRDVSDLKKSQEKIMRTSEAQASGIKQINHSMQTIGHNQRGISTKIEEITKLSNSCFEQVESGFKLVQNNLEKMEAIKTENEQALVKIRTLNDQIVKISDVVGIINSIADQTKIIAFNAELEASSAGEAGKNFQIVASEIRRLADNTVTSTKEIKAKIAEIQGSSDQLVLVVEKGTKNITEGYSITNSLKDIFATIRQTTEVSNQSMGNIQKSVEEQNISSNEVLSELERIAQI
jgi:PAS domain S-box-containing protein